MYSWADAQRGAHLPDEAVYLGDVMTRSGSDFIGTTYKILDGAAAWELRLVSDSSLILSRPYLFGAGITDQFASTYMLGSVALNRGSPAFDNRSCEWFGSDSGVDYVMGMDLNVLTGGLLKWTWQSTIGSYHVKDGNQNRPDGTYNGGASSIT